VNSVAVFAIWLQDGGVTAHAAGFAETSVKLVQPDFTRFTV